ncbi:phosphatidylserine decarboxylase-domain-containing protein [Lipomyces japonicus]|uniref:phosphatidylserine decarboxylase-domain-containing protein n=1 Tax=Lipomyces japonicus TaxID=56871 RepID=UPI0034CED929
MPLSILGRRQRGTRSASSSAAPSRSQSPKASLDPILFLNVELIEANNLAAKDRGGTSDPYAVVKLDDARVSTQAISKTLNPQWNASFKIGLYHVDSEFILEGTVWDKDVFRKDYLGSFDISLEERFGTTNLVRDTLDNTGFWVELYSARRKSNYVKGSIFVRLSLSDPDDAQASNELLLSKWRTLVPKFDPYVQLQEPSSSDTDSVQYSEDDGIQNDNLVSTGKPVFQQLAKQRRRRRLRLRRRKSLHPYNVGSAEDVVGVLFFEVVKVTDLPPERNVTRTGFDMDPFVIVSFGKKVVRTEVQKHSLNPEYHEKVLFPVLRHEQGFLFNFSVIDQDALSNNDFVANATFPVSSIIKGAPQPDSQTGLYKIPSPSLETIKAFRERSPSRLSVLHLTSSSAQSSIPVAADESVSQVTTEYRIPLTLKNKARWEEKHSPIIHFNAKYVPYAALRQQFWSYLLRKYDVDDSGEISRYELGLLLESLASTLHNNTVDGFWARFDKPLDQDLTYDELIMCFEDQVQKDNHSQFSSANSVSPSTDNLVPPVIHGPDHPDPDREVESEDQDTTLTGLEPDLNNVQFDSSASSSSINSAVPASGNSRDDYFYEEIDENGPERVIRISECPLCHQPRLGRRSEIDVVTHLATCASQNWKQVDMVTKDSLYVTSEQARRKWVGNVVSKVTYGGYKLGANSANILVQDRITGYIFEERMSLYVRLGIRLLYKGLRSREMERKRIRKLLTSLSIKQGQKYDDPKSVKSIKPFVEFHQLDLSDVLKPLDEFKSFNEFFYRQLVPGARPCAAPQNKKIVVSPADCRTVVFDKISLATQIWIKGREFSLERLFGKAYPDDVNLFTGGSMGIFRLAPQDYHRFHVPVDGVIGQPKVIDGAYYTVNPMAIRSDLDVYGENVRVIVPIETEAFGRVIVVCVGAMMVGSTVITAEEEQTVTRTDELGYFQFGGSTLLLFFQQGKLTFDSDLANNSKDSVETLIRVGMSIGHAPDTAEHDPGYGIQDPANMSDEKKVEAALRVEGSLAPKRDNPLL